MIYDCHTHWGTSWEQRDGVNAANWLAVLDKHRIDKAFLFGNANLRNSELCAQDNDHLAELGRKYPDRLVPMGSSWPQKGQASVAEAARCIEKLGHKGLKFHPFLQGFSTADPYFMQICGLAGELRVPVIFHDGTPCYCLPEQIAGLAGKFPRTRFVLGHMGLLWEWRSVLFAMKHPNVWGIICGPHTRAIEIYAEKLDGDRLLWGSDQGNSIEDLVDYRYNHFLRARIPDKLKDQILNQNPPRLLRYS